MTPLLGLHHVSAVAGDPQANLDHYRHAGFHLVKRTVNYDDPATHHFYYGDGAGTPGSILTFFAWGHVRVARKGSGQPHAVAFAQATDNVRGSEIRFGQTVQTESDPDGVSVEHVAIHDRALDAPPRLHSVTLRVADLAEAERALSETLMLERIGQEGERVRYAVGSEDYIDLLHDANAHPGSLGAGSIHHLALRCDTEASLALWREQVGAAGYRVSPVKDRTYFHSIYFRCAGDVLFEIATDGPGFTADEPAAELGCHLCLPPWLESHRADIETSLPPVHL
jgi:glyoxalase family protein